MEYPKRLEQEQTESEHQLLRLLIQGRIHEALMTSRNLEAKSLQYLKAVEAFFNGPGKKEGLCKRSQEHVKGSLRRQETISRASRRMMELFPAGSRKRGMLAEILSIMQLCLHRNALVRRTILVCRGRTLSMQRRASQARPS